MLMRGELSSEDAEAVRDAVVSRWTAIARKRRWAEPISELAVTDAWAAIVRKTSDLHKIEPEKLQRWLDSVLLNRGRDLMRRAGPSLYQSSLDEVVFELPTAGPTPEDLVLRDERRRRVRETLTRMSRLHKQIFVLYQLRQLTSEEVGLQVGRSPDRVRHIWRHILEALRLAYRTDEPLPGGR